MYRSSSVGYTNKKADVIAGAGENPVVIPEVFFCH